MIRKAQPNLSSTVFITSIQPPVLDQVYVNMKANKEIIWKVGQRLFMCTVKFPHPIIFSVFVFFVMSNFSRQTRKHFRYRCYFLFLLSLQSSSGTMDSKLKPYGCRNLLITRHSETKCITFCIPSHTYSIIFSKK